MKDKTRKSRKRKLRPGISNFHEEGAIVKDWGGRLPIALIYPNSYYLGMSNLGIHTIYRLLNNEPKVVCERVFVDITARNTPVSIESRRPLSDFAVLAFSVSYELDYFNVANILKAAGLPVYAIERNEHHPLIIAGGPCISANPMPVAPFFDCLCIGEAEAILPALLDVLQEGIGEKREELLSTMANLPGLYVPSCPPKMPVNRQYARNLNDFATTSSLFTPDTELGDLFLIEVERGCQRGCRFCLVNTIFAPMRFCSIEKLIMQARQGSNYRNRIGLVGPAVTDHPQIGELLTGLNQLGTGISISSLRINSLSSDILNELDKGNTRSITVAPEAGSIRLRDIINKSISIEDILEVADMIAGHRFKQLKLYFIIGLPTETDDDIEEITALSLAIKARLDLTQCKTRLVLNIAPFVPKAGTPFQWLPMSPQETLNHRLTMLKNTLPHKGIKLNTESPAWSYVQGSLSRGDEKLAAAIANMNDITLSRWREAVKKYNLDIDYYVNRQWDTSQKLPWSVINPGTKPERLCEGLSKALE